MNIPLPGEWLVQSKIGPSNLVDTKGSEFQDVLSQPYAGQGQDHIDNVHPKF